LNTPPATPADVSADELPEVAAGVLEQAAQRGVDAAEVTVSTALGWSVTARAGAVETLEHSNDRSLSLTVYQNRRKGSVGVSDFAPQAIADAVEAACNIARYTSEDDCAGLADAELMAGDCPDLDLHRRWDIGVDDAIALAVECDDEMRAADRRVVNTEGASIATTRGVRCYANTHGFSCSVPSTRHSISAVAVAAADNGDGMQRDFWYSTHRHPGELEPHRDVGRRAAARALRRLGARKIKTRKAPVLFEAAVATSLFAHLAGAVSGDALYRKTSFLTDALGEQLFPAFVRVTERPRLSGMLGSAAFDAEGVATKDHAIVEDGVLASYVLSSYSARKLGMTTTANAGGIHNWVFEGEARPFDALLEKLGEGLLVTELMGHGVNQVTGDYSRGAAGFWVEGGRVAYPVSQVTIAANLRDMFKAVVAVGDDTDLRGTVLCGSVLVGEMMIAGA